jgi:hypothetical protein
LPTAVCDRGYLTMKRSFLFALPILASLLLGFYLGHVWAQRRFNEGARILSQFLALKEYEVLADLQYKESTAIEGKQSLLGLLAFMDKIEKERGVAPFMQQGLYLDRGNAYVRLAFLEENEGNKARSEEYIRQAQVVLRKTNMNDTSEGHLREVVTKLDATTHYMLPYVLTFAKSVK